MGHWERDLEHLASTCGGRVHSFCRYADDYLVLFEGSDENFNVWVNSLNNKDQNIKVIFLFVYLFIMSDRHSPI